MAAPRRGIALLVSLLLGVGCASSPPIIAYPRAEVFSPASDFAGSWIGEVENMSGMLEISALEAGRYRGVFRAENVEVRYILALEQVTAEAGADGGAGDAALTNLVRFTWQDGRGGRGHGWLLINAEDSALTGSHGEGESPGGLGEWTFIRVE